MAITASALRQNIYKLLDQIIETNIPLEIERRGTILKIVPQQKPDKLKNLKKRNITNGDPSDIIHIN